MSVRGAAPLFLHMHQLPQGHGMGTGSPSHEDLLYSARALPLGVAHQGSSLTEGNFLLS